MVKRKRQLPLWITNIDFTLIKDNKGNWNIDDLTNEMKEKLLGIN